MEAAGKLLSTVKRKAAELQSGAMTVGRGHTELSMAIFTLKHGAQALTNMAQHELRVSRSIKEWASTEQNVCLAAVYVKLAELSQIQAQIIHNLTNQHIRRRKAFKDLLAREKELDELNKDVESQRAKVTKLAKQVAQCRTARKVDMLKVETLQVDLDKAKEIEKESTENLDKEIQNHEQFKFELIKDVLSYMVEAGRRYHTESLQVLEVEEQLRQLFLPQSYNSCTEDMATAAQIEAANLVNGLAESLNLTKPTSMLEKNSMLERRQTNTRPSSQLIRSDRMLNNDPKYVGVPDQEVPDAENIRRPLPPPPIADLYSQPLRLTSVSVDSDDSEDDYTEPYQFLTSAVNADLPPARTPPNPPTEYLEMYHNRSRDLDSDGIRPKMSDDDETLRTAAPREQTNIDKDGYLIPRSSMSPTRPPPPSTTMPAQTVPTSMTTPAQNMPISTSRKTPMTLPEVITVTSQSENNLTSPRILPQTQSPNSPTPQSLTISTSPQPQSPKSHPVASPRTSVGQRPKSPKSPPAVKPKPPGLLPPKPAVGKPVVKTKPAVRPRPISKPAS